MAEVKSVVILLDSVIDGGKAYKSGDIVLNASASLLACADEKRKGRDGLLICKRLTKTEAVRAAKRADAEDEGVIVTPEPEPEPELEEDEDVDEEEE